MLKILNSLVKFLIMAHNNIFDQTNNHDILTFPLLIPLNYPTTCVSAYGKTGSFKLTFFCWAILKSIFHFYYIFDFSFLIVFGSCNERYILLVSLFYRAL